MFPKLPEEGEIAGHITRALNRKNTVLTITPETNVRVMCQLRREDFLGLLDAAATRLNFSVPSTECDKIAEKANSAADVEAMVREYRECLERDL